MQSIQLKTHVGEDGLLKVQMPPEIKDLELDVMVVFQPSSNEEQPRRNAWGKPNYQRIHSANNRRNETTAETSSNR